MGEFSLVGTILERERIKYTFQVIDPSGKWLGKDTSRRIFGSNGLNKNYDKQYVDSVKKIDVENAKYFVHSVLRS